MTDFTLDQKRYLEGFASGLSAARATGALAGAAPQAPSGPDAIHLEAQDRFVAAGKKLADQERWKRAEHPFEAHARLKAAAEAHDRLVGTRRYWPRPDPRD